MKILYMDWNSFCRKDALEAWKKLGHEICLMDVSHLVKTLGNDVEEVGKIAEYIRDNHCDFAFSMNYFPMVSEACNQVGIPYISWIYDNPYMRGYSVSIIHDCNYIFTFDSAMYEELAAQGVSTVFYAPMAANPERIGAKEGNEFWHDISFVGALYNEDHNFYDEFVENAKRQGKEYYIGYVDALIQTQLNLYGSYILDTSVPKEIVEAKFASTNVWSEVNSFFMKPERIFTDDVLCRKITQLERKQLLEQLSSEFAVDLYTRDARAKVGNCRNHGYVDYSQDMPKVFQNSKINLNISLKSIQKGIPLRAIEIMGAGGFLLSNFQADFLMHFQPDVDFVYYEDFGDAQEKARFYLSHETERRQIARNGWEQIRENHTYEKRFKQMLEIVKF